MKLTKDQKAELKVLCKMANDAGVILAASEGLRAVIGFYQDFPYAKTVNVTVSHMDKTEQDKFRPNTGIYFVLKRIFNGETIKMPTNGFTTVQQLADDLLHRLAS